MSLSLLLRLNAVFLILWAIGLIFSPGTMFDMFEWTPSLELVALGQGLGVASTGLAIVSWMLPSWMSEQQLKKAAICFAIIASLFLLLQLYQILISNMSPGKAFDWGSTVITALFAIGFYMKSR